MKAKNRHRRKVEELAGGGFEAPADEIVPSEAPADEGAPSEAPVDEDVPSEAPALAMTEDEWPSSRMIRGSRVGLYVIENVHDRRMRDEMLLQIEGLSWDEFCTLNSLSFREFDRVVQGAIFDAGEKVKFWERFDEYSRAGRRVLADVSAKRREWLRRILLRDLGYVQYRCLNQLPDGLFVRSLEILLESLETRGSQRLEHAWVEEAVEEAQGARPFHGSE